MTVMRRRRRMPAEATRESQEVAERWCWDVVSRSRVKVAWIWASSAWTNSESGLDSAW